MGNNKNTILVLVVIALFIASAVVLYKGFFQGTGGSRAVPDIAGAQKEIVNLLPYGTNLDFSKVKNRTASTTTINYEMVDQNNVGVDIHSLISSVSSDTAVPTQVTGAQTRQRTQ